MNLHDLEVLTHNRFRTELIKLNQAYAKYLFTSPMDLARNISREVVERFDPVQLIEMMLYGKPELFSQIDTVKPAYSSIGKLAQSVMVDHLSKKVLEMTNSSQPFDFLDESFEIY